MPTVVDRYPTLVPMLDALRVDHDRHFDVVASILGPNGPGVDAPFFEVDIVLVSVLNRSLDLLDGFVDTFERWNISSAAPLVRLQVDNLLRLNLLTVAPPGSVTPLLLSGEPLRKADDPLSKGKKTKLTDHRLRQLAAENFPWLDQVYERASGWVHFSSVHIGVTLRIDDAGVMEGRFPSDTDRYPPEFLEQVLWSMMEATNGILAIADDFAAGKAESSKSW